MSEVGTLQQLAGRCLATAAACDPAGVPEAQRVEGTPGGGFQVSWEWLRDALVTAQTAKSSDRAHAMQLSVAHLAELSASAGVDRSESPGEWRAARRAADAALSRAEFRTTERPGWLERQIAKGQDWLLRMLSGVSRIGRKAPWLPSVVEGCCFLLAAVGLLWFVRQSLSRQALRISLAGTPLGRGPGERGAAAWARQSEQLAASGQWRDAIHAAYWAGVSTLEERRAWRANETRTPREYLRLLQGGSEVHRILRDLTRGLERVWYGYAEAREQDYRTAWECVRALEGVRLESASPVAATAGKTAG